MSDDYYRLARSWEKLTRQDLAIQIRKFHQQAVDQVVEFAAEVLRQAREEGNSLEEVEKSLREIELDGENFADDRAHLRKAEAILFALREREAIIVAKGDVARAYDAGDGVDVGTISNGTGLEVVQQKGKFAGQ